MQKIDFPIILEVPKGDFYKMMCFSKTKRVENNENIYSLIIPNSFL